MNYNIINEDAFTVLEKVEQHIVVGDQNKNNILEFWGRVKSDSTILWIGG